MRDSIFVSYCREDYLWLNELKASLGTLDNDVRLNVWDDSRISPAAEWQGEINEALSTAAAAVLLLSPSFFASEFISKYELPPLLEAARRGELKLFPIIVSPCGHDQITSIFQTVNDPAQPISILTDAERQSVWKRVLEQMMAVEATIAEETRVEAEILRLENDLAAQPEIKAINDKINKAKTHPDLQGIYLEEAICSLEVQEWDLRAAALLEEAKRPELTATRSTAIVRLMGTVMDMQQQAFSRKIELMKMIALESMREFKAAMRSGDKT